MENTGISKVLEDMELKARGLISSIFHSTTIGREYMFEKGIYRYFPLTATKTIQNALSIDREILAVLTNFNELQARTITAVKNLLAASQDRYERSILMVIHNDKRGGSKLRNWGRENGYTIISLYYPDLLQGKDVKSLVNSELYNQDPFDITGPVSSESEFFGRRDEAISFARKIQQGTISSILGLRKTGKTSVINRVTAECNEKYDDTILFVDCSRDDVWSLDAAKLLKMIFQNIKDAREKACTYSSLTISRELSPVTVEAITEEIDKSDRQIILVFDEFDYLTPSSPTNSVIWAPQFNQFWRQMRVVFQEVCRRKRNLSIVLCGVSSKWFRVADVDGVENAAANLIPEEYLRPLQDNAVVAMVKTLGNRCGLSFEKNALDVIYRGTSGIPSWIRKFCSYLNRKVPLENKPFEVSAELASQLLHEYTAGEGISYSRVAVEHLFSVFPEMKTSLVKFVESPGRVSPNEKLLLESYGVSNAKSTFTGEIMKETISFCLDSSKTEVVPALAGETTATAEWADEIAELAKRQNIVEKSLRKIVVELLRSDSRINTSKGTSKDRIIKCVEDKRKRELAPFSVDIVIEKTYWLELISIFKKEWSVFEAIFGDQGLLFRYMELLNDRPYAHAKDLDPLDLAVAKSALKHIEELILKYENA